jgi:twitching motility protein PilI
MAKREALRELQARLAKRLQMAQVEGMAVSWLAVRAASAHYLLPLAQSGEIVALTAVQRVPFTKAWYQGVLNVRGNVVGVVDLGAFLAVDQARPPSPAVANPDASAVTFNSALDVHCALRVDSLVGLRGKDAFATSAEKATSAPAYFGPCFVDAEGLRWQVLDLRALAQTPSFLTIAA